MQEMTDNAVHQLFYDLGVNIDYVPADKHEAFTMALQFVAAVIVLRWFVKFLFSFVRSMYGGKW